jgi:ABC-type glycerol-3-phosphate transport system substrate-binding protein
MENLLTTLRAEDDVFQEVAYVEKNPETYQSDLVSAMAAGVGPDLFLIGHEDILGFADKVLIIPFNIVSQGTFVSSYIDEGQLFLTSEGSLALPLLVDPLVMYWNRALFSSVGVASAPKYWNDFLTLAPKIISLDSSTLRRSAAALGTWANIKNAKAILSSLIMQAGDPLVARSADGTLYSVLGTTPESAAENPGTSALRFYTEFANPSKAVYSWNRSLPEAQDAFVAGDVAAYFGFASEYKTLLARNPNLQLGVEVLPQIQGNGARLTYGALTGAAISRSARNPQGAALVAQRLTGERAIAYLSQATGLPPVRRDVSVDTSASAVAQVFVQSALIARGWLDPSPKETDAMFKEMIESVVSGRSLPAEAIADAARLLEQLIRSQPQTL